MPSKHRIREGKSDEQPKNRDRNNLVKSMRGEGRTYREIAAALGISIDRARQIYDEGVADDLMPMELSVRALNQIANALYDRPHGLTNREYKPDPQVVADRLEEIRQVRPTGRRALYEIIAWLKAKGIEVSFDPDASATLSPTVEG